MRKVVLALVLVLVVVGGYKAAVWYGTLNWLNTAQADIESAGVLSWDGIDSTLGGQVTVNNLRLQLFDLTLPIRVGSISLSRPTPWALLMTLFGSQEAPPRNWTLSVNNLDMALEPGLFKSWAVSGDSGDSSKAFQPWGIYACGASHTLSVDQLIAMGIHQLHGSASLIYQTDMQAGLIRSKLSVNAGTLGSFDLNLVSPPPDRWGALDRLEAWPVPQSLQWVVRDGGFMRRLSAYCSRQADRTEQRWSQAAAQDWKAALAQHGIVPSQDLLRLYENWMENGGELTLSLQSQDDDTSYTSLLQGTPDQAIQALGVRLAYNGTPVSSLSVTLDRDKLAQSLAPPAPAPAVAAKPQALPPEPAYRDTPVAQAVGWVGRMVKVTAAGKTLEGRLDRVDDNTLQVAQNVQGGVVEYPVAMDQVTTLQVWRTPGEAPPHPIPAPTPVPAASATSSADQTTSVPAAANPPDTSTAPASEPGSPAPATPAETTTPAETATPAAAPAPDSSSAPADGNGQ